MSARNRSGANSVSASRTGGVAWPLGSVSAALILALAHAASAQTAPSQEAGPVPPVSDAPGAVAPTSVQTSAPDAPASAASDASAASAPPAAAEPAPASEAAPTAAAEPIAAQPEAAPATSTPTPPPPTPPPPMAAEVAPAFVTLAAPAAPPSKLPAYILWGAGGISLAVGAIVGVKALAAKRDFDDKPSFSLADRAEERAMVADIAFGLGIALAVTGTFFFFDAEDTEDEDESGTTAQAARTRGPRGPIVHVAPVIGPRVGGAAASLQF